jgi:WhiB family redox-sensing transcriptional regulator
MGKKLSMHRTVSQRYKLSEGIYLVRTQQWTSVEAFNSNEQIPEPVQLIETYRNVFSPPLWTEEALCLGLDDELFFGNLDDWEPRNRFVRSVALHICEQCPVRRECLRFAIDNNLYYGIWGGADSSTRSNLHRLEKLGLDDHPLDDYLNREVQFEISSQNSSRAFREIRPPLSDTSE